MNMRFRICYGLTVIFRVEQVRESGAAVGTFTIGIVFPPFRVFGNSFVTQADFVFIRTQLDDFEITFFANPKTILHILTIGVIELRHVTQALDAFIQLDKHSKRSVTDNAAANQIPDRVVREELFPRVGLELFDPERQAMVVAVDVQDHCIDAVAFL